MISGTWSGANGEYKGYYNYFNIGAYGSSTETILTRGLTYAKNKGWTNPEKAIKGGAYFLSKEYISCGQDTLYLQKFNVADSQKNYYTHQYMTNVSASMTEGEEVREAYRDMNMISKTSKMKFKIPVYKNMPETRAAIPGTEKIVTQDVQVTANNVIVRSGKGTNYSVITTLSKDTKILRIELDNNKDANGRYWDKVVLNNGTKGYISREYLKEIAVQSNCNESYIVSKYTNFRNGPGTKGNISTTVIKLLSPGQVLTVVEKGKYENVDGEKWYRVKLADGSYGYVGTEYIEPFDASKSEEVKVVCTDGLNIRKEPSSTSSILRTVTVGTILTRTQKDVASSDKQYIWDKVTTSGGTVGYVVRQDPKTQKAWIEPVNNSNGNTNTIQTAEFKESGSNILCIPNLTIENIKKTLSDAVIKNGTKTESSGNIATGWTITTGGKTYTAVVKGDTNGDGKVTSADYVRIKNYMINKTKLNEAQEKASDVTGDGKVTSADYVRIKNYMLNKAKISI